jgi:1,5-anhydro-D-fructose reductase (1,5-anhydro-D-mannitol-forming)
MINIGVIGVGKIAKNSLIPAIQHATGACFWSVLSRDIEKAQRITKEFSAESPKPAFDELEAFLSDPKLDAVIVASPDKLHAHHSLAAIDKGKHVLVEKPMATSTTEADMMLKAAHRAGVKLAVAYHMRWHAGHRKLSRQVWSGAYGELQTVRAQWTFNAPDSSNWRAHNELGRWWSLAGVGTHCLDWILWMMRPVCGEVEDIQSVVSRTDVTSTHDTSAAVHLRFQSGAIAHMFCSAIHDAPRIGEIYGSAGYAFCRETIGTSGSGEIVTHAGALNYKSANPYVGEIEDFAAAIADDRDPEATGEDGLRNIELLVEICP